MEIVLAKTAGFCFGVKRAVDQVYQQLQQEKKIYTYGPIIHNEEVVKDLQKKGVCIIDTEEELSELKEGVVILRSHGVPERVINLLKAKHLEVIDMTCPFVKRIHEIVNRESENSNIVIVGNPGHPEVEGIRGWSKTQATVVSTVDEALHYQRPDEERPVCIVSQTTFNYNKFQEIIEIFEKKGYDINIVNTICDATRKRQTEAREIASDADVMIVVGDTQSSNSKKLYEICSQECEKTYFIQTSRDLKLETDKTVRKIGITAGASTPNNIIEEVQNNVRNFF